MPYTEIMKAFDADAMNEREPAVLDAATLAAVDKAQQSFDAGKGLTIKEARELNRRRYQAWLNLPMDLNNP